MAHNRYREAREEGITPIIWYLSHTTQIDRVLLALFTDLTISVPMSILLHNSPLPRAVTNGLAPGIKNHHQNHEYPRDAGHFPKCFSVSFEVNPWVGVERQQKPKGS